MSILCTWKKGAQVPGATACSSSLLSERLGMFNKPVLKRACWFHSHRLGGNGSPKVHAAGSGGEGQEGCSRQGRLVTQATHDPHG